MIKKILIFITIMYLTNACDYKPLYSTDLISNYNISSIEINGDKNINNFIKRGLDNYKNADSNISYKIILNTSYSKNILAKDKTANTTDYKLSVNVEMIVIEIRSNSTDKIEKKITFKEDLNVKKNSNNFSQANYENISKINLAEIILNKIILFLSNQNDN
tara:strand:+ start:180 stop:662 length:483 start_codon:yes stop_codon:yes gene_type:complete